MRLHLLLLPLLLVSVSVVVSQTQSEDDNLRETLARLAESAGRSYVAPIVSGFGADLNSGWFHRAPWANMFGFDFEIGLVGASTFIKDENRNYSTTGSFRFNRSQATFLAQQATSNPSAQASVRDAILSQEFDVVFSGPTIAGARNDSTTIAFPGKTIVVGGNPYNLPAQAFRAPIGGVLDGANFVPLFPIPQMTIGTLLGSQFTFRYLPEVELSKEIGKFKYTGFGIQHNPLVWFGEDALPFEVSLGYFTQTMTIGSFMDAKATAFGVNSSIRLGWGFLNLTPYAGFMIESSDITWNYDYEFETPTGTASQKIQFTTSGENKSRFTVGASVKVLIINVNADISFSKYQSISAGVMFII